MDRIDKKRRSWNMSRIRGKNTKPEILVRSALHAMGYRFRLHPRALPGRPDIVLPKYRTALFVHGCFWHRHGCQFSYTPKSRVKFWQRKFSRNVERDLQVRTELKSLGWRVVTLWECQVKSRDRLEKRIQQLFPSLSSTDSTAEPHLS
jgi:DNA mismatch endonuclease (patch repair protein)